MRCAMCGRVTLKPALLVGQQAIGPKCAQKRGLMPKAGRVGRGGHRAALRSSVVRASRCLGAGDTMTMSLFDDEEAA